MLTGPHLSPVQVAVATILEALDRENERKRDHVALATAVITSTRNLDEIIKLGAYFLPEIFGEADVNDDDAPIPEGTTEEGDPIATTYDFSRAKDERSKEEIEREHAMLLAQISAEGTTNLDDEGDWV